MSSNLPRRRVRLESLIVSAVLMVIGVNFFASAVETGRSSTAPSRPSDDGPAMPDTLAGRKMAAILKLFQSKTEPDLEAFLDRHDPSSSKRQRAHWKDQFSMMYSILKSDVRLSDVLWSEEHNIGIRVSNAAKSRWNRIILELTDDAPHAISRLGLRRGTAPQDDQAELLTAAQQAAVVRSVAEELRKGYIIDGTGQRFADRIVGNLEANVYDSITDPKVFAARMTEDFGKVYPDKHLAVFAPERTPPAEPADHPRGHAGGAHDIKPPDGNSGLEAHGPANLANEEAFRVERLRNDTIGLVTFTSMYSNDDEALPRVAALMDSLAGVETIIFDLREANGGDPSFVNALTSCFFEKATLLGTTAIKWPPEYGLIYKEHWTTPNDHSAEFASLPIYLLISPNTASGPEGFTANLKGQDRATLVGERTAGAGHMTTNVTVAEGFVLKLPIARSVDPKTGEGNGFEGIGHAPGIEVPAERALDKALELIEKSR